MSRTAPAGIMVVGADSHFSYLMRRYMRTSAHQVHFANPGEDALAAIRRERPVAIILGAGIPDVLRRDMLHALKANQATREIPVILCSWQEEALSAQTEGADLCLPMPILYEDFVAALAQVGVLVGA
ncbi:MAG: response regulator [Anaerolineae bacterium]